VARQGKARALRRDNEQEKQMSDEQTLYPWNEGLPTKPDVDLLLKTWPSPKIGDRFEYDVIESLLGIAHTAPRFRTVTNQWRARLLEQNLVCECETGTAFYIATADQISARTYGTLRGIGRKARKQRQKLSVSKPEDDAQRAVIEHQGRLLNVVERDAKKARMNLLPTTTVSAAPRIAPPKSKDGAA
jgi:hypothetical protein